MRRMAGLFLGLVLVCAGAQAADDPPVEPIALGDGLTLHVERTSLLGPTFFWALLPEVELEVRDVRQSGVSATTYRNLCQGAVLVTSGGYWGHDQAGAPMPLGLVVTNGTRRSRAANWRNGGAIVVDGAKLNIVESAALRENLRADQALQSMPLLIRDGRALPAGAGARPSQRLAIALTDRGELLVAGVTAAWGNGMTLRAFTQRLLHLPLPQGARVRDALALDGGASVYLHLPATGNHYGRGDSAYVPNALCFHRRRR